MFYKPYMNRNLLKNNRLNFFLKINYFPIDRISKIETNVIVWLPKFAKRFS